MRRMPFFLGLAFIIVTVSRVADFAGGGILAWSMAVGLACSVFISAYFLDWDRPRVAAIACLLFFLVVDTAFNLGETLKWSVETERWDFALPLGNFGQVPIMFPIYRVADFVYGVFPTSSAALLGWLARKVDKIGVGRKMGFVATIKHELLKWLMGEVIEAKPKVEAEAKPEPKPEPKAKPKPKAKSRVHKQAEIEAYLREHPEATLTEIATEVGCSLSTASKWRNEYKESQ